MAPKKSLLVLIIVLLTMAFVTAGCERAAYTAPEGAANPDGSLATPTLFPDAMPADGDMENLFEAGAQTQQALEAGTLLPAPATETPNPDAAAPPADGTTPVAVDPTTAPAVEAATTAPPAPVPAGSVPASYTLQKGEFPYCIARRYNVNPQELLTLNGLTSAQGQLYEAGAVLQLPTTGNPFPSDRALNSHPISYTLPQNMTLYAVACHFGDISPDAIKNANSIADVNNIPTGTVLNIP